MKMCYGLYHGQGADDYVEASLDGGFASEFSNGTVCESYHQGAVVLQHIERLFIARAGKPQSHRHARSGNNVAIRLAAIRDKP